MNAPFAALPLHGFEIAHIGTSGARRLGGIEFQCTEHKASPRQLEFRTPRLGAYRLVSVSLQGGRPVYGHLYTPGVYLLFNFFPWPAGNRTAACGSHTLWMVRGEWITVIERTSKKRLLGGELRHGPVTLRVASSDGDRQVTARIDGLGDDEAVADVLLGCAFRAGNSPARTWPAEPGTHRFAI